jgi:hypothetical protein
VFPLRYELGFYISEDGILHSHRREHLFSSTVSSKFTEDEAGCRLTKWALPSKYVIMSSLQVYEQVGGWCSYVYSRSTLKRSLEPGNISID